MDKLNEAIEILGGVTAAARVLRVSQSCISNRLKRGTQISAEDCLWIDKHTNGVMPCEEMRPDLPWHILRNGPRSLCAPPADTAVSIQMIAATEAANDAADIQPGRA